VANSVVHFEIFTSDIAKAQQFYQQVFGWRFESAGFPDFFHIHMGVDGDPGLRMGALAKRQRQKADPEASTNAFRCTIAVKSIKDTLAALQGAGGKLRSSITEIPHVGKVAEVTDDDGNVFCVMEHVPGHSHGAR
jgi:predicted enzyme related to lactoylglutathione lyase